jgi:hypothetical protein
MIKAKAIETSIGRIEPALKGDKTVDGDEINAGHLYMTMQGGIATFKDGKKEIKIEFSSIVPTGATLLRAPGGRHFVLDLSRVAVDRDEEIKRMSHDRRGHWRTYRHTRYTYARGSTRWVKQAWCGPKEWMDAGGKQIYKILEPVNEEPCVLTTS